MHLPLTPPAVHQPLSRIRKNMREEGGLQVIGLCFLAVLPRFFTLSPMATAGYYSLYAVLVAICGYYLYKFYRFYQHLSTADLSTREHLYSTYYEIRVHIEMYRSYTYIILVMMFGFATLYGLTDAPFLLERIGEKLQVNPVLVIAAVFVAIVTLLAVATECTLESQYGKYLKEIRQQLSDLTTEEK